MWPNASVNKAVATRMGRTRVAVCLAPTRLEINGNPDQLYDGESLSLPGGVSVSRSGNVYVIRRHCGDIVRAEVNNGWIKRLRGLCARGKRCAVSLAMPMETQAMILRHATEEC
jgi:hypothetical protein